jgi:hypothetical protein
MKTFIRLNTLAICVLSLIQFTSISCSKDDDPEPECEATYDGQIKALFQAKCQGGACHPTNGDWFTYSTAFNKLNQIKTRTQDGSMPKVGSLTAEEKELIACWVDNGAPEN